MEMEKKLKKRKYFLKMIIIGDSGVGKTSLIHRYVSTRFIQEFKPTIGAEFSTKEIEIDGNLVGAQIWDTAGEERYQSLGVSFYRGADCCGIVFDRSNRDSFEKLSQWRKAFISQGAPEDQEEFPFIIIGNKSDLTNEVLIKRSEVEDWCTQYGNYVYIEASAKDNISVEEVFETLMKTGMDRQIANPHFPKKMSAKGRSLHLNQKSDRKDDSKRDGCCGS
ncbi:unnamed protein product [Moneuplotes crassus]|uniref:Ras-related protein Rab-7b n=1 Tax=Euplotes crassus TaxID=5936 RepID=A0AAD1XXA9_EUPCR|nr:unnamed protein product [Moneuplotes crassus]